MKKIQPFIRKCAGEKSEKISFCQEEMCFFLVPVMLNISNPSDLSCDPSWLVVYILFNNVLNQQYADKIISSRATYSIALKLSIISHSLHQ